MTPKAHMAIVELGEDFKIKYGVVMNGKKVLRIMKLC